MKFAIAIGVHDRIDDLDAHLDILDFMPVSCKKIIAYSHPNTPNERIAEWEKRAIVIKVPQSNFCIGPLLSLTSSLKSAQINNCDYLVYRNADDWLFNHESLIGRLFSMPKRFLFAGYNWLTHNTYQEFALNEITFHVPTFSPFINKMESYFINSSQQMLCEFKIARWVNKIISKNDILKLAERERYPGVGNDFTSLEYMHSINKVSLPENWKERWKDNQRFFHRYWQMIGSHNQKDRLFYYNYIKKEIDYADKLEQKPEFRRWLFAAKNNLPWNLPGTSQHIGGRKILNCNSKPPKFIPSFHN